MAQVEQRIEAAGSDDREIVERARQDGRAFETLYRRHFKMVSNYVYRRIGDAHAAEDVVSDVFIAALRTLHRYEDRGIPIRFWLLRIATNAIHRRLRSEKWWATLKPVAAHECVDEGPRPSDAIQEEEAGRARAALRGLPANAQAVLSLHYIEGLSIDEVALVLGWRTGSVKSRLSRAREALRSRLERQDAEEERR
jgi:RNA polymerase sigma-70 factor (ECF subfamily)